MMLQSIGFVGVGAMFNEDKTPCCAEGWLKASVGLTKDGYSPDKYTVYWGKYQIFRTIYIEICKLTGSPEALAPFIANDNCSCPKLRKIRTEASLKLMDLVEEISSEAQELVNTYKEKYNA